MEFDRNLIERSLNAWNFDVDQILTREIQHVPMHEWRISSKNKPLLYVENLQCCVGLYAYGNNFAFAAHINTVVFDNDEYIIDESRIPLYCNRPHDLLEQILNYKSSIVEPFKIGISLGVTPLANTEIAMKLIYQGMDELIEKLNFYGIPVVQLEPIYEPEFIIDALNNCIITPKQKRILKKY